LSVTGPVEVSYNSDLPPDAFDMIIIDECHRSIYGLWRQVLEYFHAHLIGLTATPTKQTFGFFRQNLVMEYSHDMAVTDRVNVDFTVYKIQTAITQAGSTIEAGDFAGYRDRQRKKIRWDAVDEPIACTAAQLDRAVVAEDQIRTVIQTFKDKLFTELFPGRKTVPKTQMLGRGVRVINDTEFQAVTDDAKTKDRFLVVDAVGVMDSPLAETVQPLERKPAQSLKDLLKQVAFGSKDPQVASAILDVRRSYEQTIDEVSKDEVLFAGHSAEAREKASALVSSFQEYIEEHKDDIRALQVLYSRPHKERLTFTEVKELARAIERPPRQWTPDILWRAYELLDKSKVRGSGSRMLTDIVSLVRYTLHQDDELVPFRDQVEKRFAAWLSAQQQKGATFTLEQSQWLTWMKENIAGELRISPESFEYTPFVEHGGIGKAVQVFGERLAPLLDELTEVLAA
jgi:type I site-specific restriction endonuclease